MKIVIMAGGRGTRIASVNSEVPKPMIPVNGKPVLEYQLECCKRQGFKDFIFVVGYMADKITDYFGDGLRFGVHIEYIVEKNPLGTAGALYYLQDQLTEDFILMIGDAIFDIDLLRFCRSHTQHQALVSLFTHPNDHPYDSSVVVTDKEGRVTQWLNKEDERVWYKNRVNAGVHIMSPEIFEECHKMGLFDQPEKLDLDRQILKPLIPSGRLYAYDSPEYIKDMGTPDRYARVANDLQSGLVRSRNLSNKQHAIFLDRDGTLNKYVGFLRHIDQMELDDRVSEAVRLINQSGYLAIVVTNQPVIARGEVTFEELDQIHNKMETLLGQKGAYLDAIYVCPHHTDKGFEGEVPELKFECSCRKPKPGMLLQAAEDLNIDLASSWMIGDSKIDIQAGKAAGCRTALISNADENEVKADILGENLYYCVLKVLSEKSR